MREGEWGYRSRPSYFVDVQYEAEGVTYSTTIGVSYFFYNEHEEGDTVPVMYDEKNPQYAMTCPDETQDDRAMRIWGLGFLGLLAFVGLLIALMN